MTLLNTNQGFIWGVFGAIRENTIAQSSNIVAIAMIIGSVLVAFKLIKMTYVIAADERTGGFGGITLWEIGRPLCILLLIANSTWMVKGFDSIFNNISVAIANSVKDYGSLQDQIAECLATAQLGDSDFEAKLAKAKAMSKATLDSLKKNRREERIMSNKLKNLIEKQNENKDNPEYDAEGASAMEADLREILVSIQNTRDGANNLLKATRIGKKAAHKFDKKFEARQKDLKEKFKLKPRDIVFGGKTVVTSICLELCDLFYLWMMAYCDIFLCVMAYFSPIVFAISLVDKWKDSTMNWIGKYFEVSLWKAIGAVIFFVTQSAYMAAFRYVYSHNNSIIDKALASGVVEGIGDVAKASTTTWILVAISIGAVFAFLSIPNITGTLFGMGTGSVQGADKAASAPIAGAGKAAGGAATAAMML